MDWTTLLKAQQSDFINRLQTKKLLHCELEGFHSELTVINGDNLDKLYKFCWGMAEKYKISSNVETVFINNLKGKLGELALKNRLANFVTEVDYEKRTSGDGKVDFALTSTSKIGIQVKARHGNINNLKWFISKEEIEKNSVIVCILILEELNHRQPEYNLVMAGFLPTSLIKKDYNKLSFTIDELLYFGGLYSYLRYLESLEPDFYCSVARFCFDNKDYQSAINNLNKAIVIDYKYIHAYYELVRVYLELKNHQKALETYNVALKVVPNEMLANAILKFMYENILDSGLPNFLQDMNKGS